MFVWVVKMSNHYRVFGIIIFVTVVSGFPLDENISGNKYIRGNLQCFSSDGLGIDQDTCPVPKSFNRRHTKYSEDGIKYKKAEFDRYVRYIIKFVFSL